MFNVNATINYNGPFNEEEFEFYCDMDGPSLDVIWAKIKAQFPTVTSVVMVITEAKAEPELACDQPPYRGSWIGE